MKTLAKAVGVGLGLFLGMSLVVQAGVEGVGDVYPAASTWNGGMTVYVAQHADGYLTVDAGSMLFSGISYLGYDQDITGTAVIIGTNGSSPLTQWVSSDSSYVGYMGNGNISISAGGSVFPGGTSYVGYETTSMGTVTVSGPNSSWLGSQEPGKGFTLGYKGNGSLAVQGGGIVTGNGILGEEPGSEGHAAIIGGSSEWYGNVTVGKGGSGDLMVVAGAKVFSDTGEVGYNTGSNGMVSVVDSEWNITGDLCVGFDGTGMLEIVNAGLVIVGQTLTIDSNGGGDSFIRLSANGMLALQGNAAGSLDDFLGLINGTDSLLWRNTTNDDWAPLTNAVQGVHYTLEYLDEGTLDGYTLLTVKKDVYIPGDANKDGRVDGSDVTILANHWQIGVNGGQTVIWEDGDFNLDGKVDGSDVTILANHWQQGVTGAVAAVPEPGTLALLLSGLLAAGAMFVSRKYDR